MIFIVVSQPLLKVWTPGQSIRFIESAWFMDDSERRSGKIEGLMGLLAGKLLLFCEVDQITVVSPNFQGVQATFQIVAECFKGANDGQEFLIMDFIVSLCRKEGF